MGDVAADLVVEFDTTVQSLAALQAAPYRLIGTATCQIEQVAGRLVCRLSPVENPHKGTLSNLDLLRTHFLELVTDENLRERVAARTDGVRNVILALAFGSLVTSGHH
jgi:His-Xaa-Ser system protein HxsD